MTVESAAFSSDELSGEDSDEDGEEDTCVLFPFYRLTSKGVIVPLVSSAAMSDPHQSTAVGVRKVLSSKENKSCAECGRQPVELFSINLGEFLCVDCGKLHRMLGVDPSSPRESSVDGYQPTGAHQDEADSLRVGRDSRGNRQPESQALLGEPTPRGGTPLSRRFLHRWLSRGSLTPSLAAVSPPEVHPAHVDPRGSGNEPAAPVRRRSLGFPRDGRHRQVTPLSNETDAQHAAPAVLPPGPLPRRAASPCRQNPAGGAASPAVRESSRGSSVIVIFPRESRS